MVRARHETRGFFDEEERAAAFFDVDGHRTAFGHERVADRFAARLAAQTELGLSTRPPTTR